MKTLVVGFIVFGSVLLVSGAGFAQETSTPSSVSVEVGVDEQSPGNTTTVPLGFHAPEGTQLGKIVAEITYPTRIFSFEEVQRDLSAEAANAEVTAAATPSGDNTVLKVTITARDVPLKQGPQAVLMLKISDSIKEEMTVPLKVKPQAFAKANPATAVQPVAGQDGEVHITTTDPAPACFFYMH